MKRFRSAVGILALLVCLSVVLLYLHARAMNRAASYNAYVILHRARRSLVESGHLPSAPADGADVFFDSGTLWIDRKRFESILGMRWHGSSGQTYLITRDGSVIEVSKGVPKVITFPDEATGNR
jgi:hypothetical protein